jgi:hypothetical protein
MQYDTMATGCCVYRWTTTHIPTTKHNIQHHIDKTYECGDILGRKRVRHGTYSMYRHYKCKCRPCRDANNEMSKKYKRKKG